MKEFKEFCINKAREVAKSSTIPGHKNETLYMLCCTLAMIVLWENRVEIENKVTWRYFFTIVSVAEHYYDGFINGDEKMFKLEENK